MTRALVAVLGGYGTFGRRIVANLARRSELELIVAGRNVAAASAVARDLRTPNVRPLAVDATQSVDVDRLLAERPAVVVDTVGPFQARDFGLARSCAASGIHYIDIADSRARVAAVTELDALAMSGGVCIISGASTVPALTTAIVDDLAPDPHSVLEVEVGISPGHRAPRGLATVSSILGYCGRPIPSMPGHEIEYGWGGLSRHRFPSPVGSRWLSDVDTPERALWRARYPSLRNAMIKAGFEIGWMHLTLSAWSRGVRAGLLPSPVTCARFALRMAALFDRFGTDTGAMFVRVVAHGRTGAEIERIATIVATGGDGPWIPATPAALVVKKLLGLPGYRPLTIRGAGPCMGMLTRDEIMSELDGLAIRYSDGGT